MFFSIESNETVLAVRLLVSVDKKKFQPDFQP